jgi:ubiquinone/menaquinone biosynthesis C-methylase UbiE
MTKTEPLDVLESVRRRYAEGARERVADLCCPVDYRADLLEVLPPEILERDYGCGDPSRFVRPGDTVLDLGSGAGKICFMASQLAGAEGRVIGVDATPEMLALARAHAPAIAARIGWDNIEFRHGHVQDLGLDLERVDAWLAAHPVRSSADLAGLRAEKARLRADAPLVADGSVDLVLSNCVLNLVAAEDKRRLFSELHRVLRPGGRCAISDIVSDEDVPEALQRDPTLWSGCISGAMREDRFVDAFARAGLHGVELVERQQEPWAVVDGIEFRSLTVVAHRPADGPCLEHREALVYRGPFRAVTDDDGHTYRRGERTAVCRKTFELMTHAPYAAHLLPVPPLVAVAPGQAVEFDCRRDARRDPRETKAGVTRPDRAPGTGGACTPDGGCC